MRPKILIVDAEESVRELVSATLGSDQRYQFFEAQDGKDGPPPRILIVSELAKPCPFPVA